MNGSLPNRTVAAERSLDSRLLVRNRRKAEEKDEEKGTRTFSVAVNAPLFCIGKRSLNLGD